MLCARLRLLNIAVCKAGARRRRATVRHQNWSDNAPNDSEASALELRGVPMQLLQLNYRGYTIEMERRDLCWKICVKPTPSELPIPHSSFGTITQSKREAVKIAERRVDRFLASIRRT